MASSLLRQIFARFQAREPTPVFDLENNPWKAKKKWPPDFSKLSHKQQFVLEKRFRRRAKIVYSCPRYQRFMTFFQWGTIISATAYMVLFMDWKDNDRAFNSIRSWYRNLSKSIWTADERKTGQKEDHTR
ncbi:hypothetical protein BDY21DRAFT_160628 [Lineolata rhizophorae]|uniref:Uncharacterized protein n=1 Tax=Lineolata rhizophorae TaxID=578093 RepID=A0A6A6P923_9PEZI|nr:hypothetical protein BDY21DRAFT_160628 [Lineolata rhizophorae]